MGDEQRQSRIATATSLVIFLDENHCRNQHVIQAIEQHGISCEKHLDHFAPGTDDMVWLSEIGRRGWSLLTTDARIRSNFLERESVKRNGIRMFYFSRNNLAGAAVGAAVAKALPAMIRLAAIQPAPFTASINRTGDVTLRDAF